MQKKLHDSIKEQSVPSFRVYKQLLNSGQSLEEEVLSTLDGSVVAKSLSKKLGLKTSYELLDKLFDYLSDKDLVDQVFGEITSIL